MKNGRRILFPLVVVAAVLAGLLSPVLARELPVDLSQVERLRLLGPNNVPLKVLVVANPGQTMHFAVELIKTIAAINEADQPPAEERVKVHVVLSHASARAQLASAVPPLLKNLVEVNDKFFTTDQWMQDWGEVAAIRVKGDPKQHIAVLDSNRGRGIAELPKILANFWNCACLKNPSTRFACGDYGGNVEVTPDDVLIIGNTSTEEFREFLASHGYRDRMVVVETDWLRVGHCDEYLSVIPNPKAAEGFTVVKANPRQALRLIKDSPRPDLEKIEVPEYREMMLAVHDYLNSAAGVAATRGVQAADAGPATPYQARVVKYLDSLDATGAPGPHPLPLMRNLGTVPPAGAGSGDRAAAMARAEEFVKMNLALATVIDSNIKAVTAKIDEVNKTPKAIHSVLSFPVLYHQRGGKHIAFVPGVVNQLIVRRHLIIPDPKIKAFRDYIAGVATKVGLVPHFLDDMPYHTLEGEIHCGTNVFRHPNRYVVKPKNLPAELAPLR
ncbi:MAG: hypothetical protein GX442_01200 [Candidatus Riflebacteria bacterium]|nr:hypothetical protein [Candidatus Riflebacteria bacterium]